MSEPDKNQTSPYEPVLSDFTIGNGLGPGWSTDSRGPGWKASLLIAVLILIAGATFFGVMHVWR